ncbi:MAG: hypothetical protein OHK0039_20440 [Bacteroidia bacterium]
MTRTLRIAGLLCALLGGTWLSLYLTADKLPTVEIADPALGHSALRIIENAGQWEAPIRYQVRLNGGHVFFEANRITYHLYQLPVAALHTHSAAKAFGAPDPVVQHHAFRMTFPGSRPQPLLQPGLRYPEYHNYFIGNDSSRWAGGVALYGMLTYQRLYEGIDLRYYGLGDDAMKYDFIVAPGADAGQIRLAFEGVEDLRIKDGRLLIRTAVRELEEMPPVAYQLIDGRKAEVPCAFALDKQTLRYVFPRGYDARYPLVIDPTVVFSTYSGSTTDNWGFTATYDDAGNAYAGGIQRNATIGSGYPTTLGAYQTAFDGGTSDVAISKFSPDGATLLYSTYLGGGTGSLTSEDQPHSMIVTPAGELVVFGRTNAPDFPVTSGAYDTFKGGGYDLFVTKFNTTGTALIASTFVGGAGDDGVNGSNTFGVYTATKHNYGDDARGEVFLDAAGNVLVAACTESFDFPTTAGVFQSTYGGGQDGVLVKLRPNLNNLIWSSFVGGNGEDAANSVKVDAQGNIFVAGGTASNNLPGINGAYFSYQGGSTDGFVLKINANGNAVLAGTYLGTNQYDQVYLLDLDRFDAVYVVGQTLGAYPIVNPPAGPVYRNPGSRQFITKLNNNLSVVQYSTTFGSTGSSNVNISPTALLVDRCDNVYVMGWGGTTNNGGNTTGMPITSDAFQANTDGSDFYMIVLSRDVQSLIYGSYFGGVNGSSSAGDHVDGGTSRFDKNGIVYHAVCAGCWGVSTFPATPGVWSNTNNATGSTPGCNLAIFKLAFDLAGVEADFTPLDEDNQPVVGTVRGCAPFLSRFDNQSLQGANPVNVQYFWDFDDNGATSTAFEPTHLYENPGVYNVMLIITDSASCNISDTAYRIIEVLPPPAVDAGPDLLACPGDTLQLFTASVGDTLYWTPATAFLSLSNIPNPLISVTTNTTIYLNLIDANGCQAQDTLEIEIDTTFRVAVRPDTIICRGGSASLNSSATAAATFTWTSAPAASIANPSAASTSVSNLDTTTMFYLLAESLDGCRAVDSVRIAVYEVFTLEDTFVCTGNSIVLNTSNGVSFNWLPNDGTLSSTTVASPVASPLVSTTYTVTAVSAAGCISTKDVRVDVLPQPQAVVGADTAICAGSSVQLLASGGISYQWTPVGGFDPTLSNPVATPDQTTRYTVVVRDAAGCADTATMTVTVNPTPPVEAIGDARICEGDTTRLRATGAQSYEWSPAASLIGPGSSNPLAFPTATTTYIVIGLDANGCQASDSVTVGVVARPVTAITGQNRLCIGGSIELTASGGDRYVWSTGDTTALIEVVPNQATTYYATAYSGQCAGVPDSITVDVFFDYPEAAFNFTPTVGYAPQEVTFTNASAGAASYVWDFGFGAPSREENPLFIYPAAGSYTITLIALSATGCADTAQAEILIDNVMLHVPSAFSPNADDSNDFFLVGYNGIRTLQVRIFSRWGPLVYESDNPDFRWDGTYQGAPVPEGVYVFVIDGVGENGRSYQRVGTVTVFR